jgi:hypothetical protein
MVLLTQLLQWLLQLQLVLNMLVFLLAPNSRPPSSH